LNAATEPRRFLLSPMALLLAAVAIAAGTWGLAEQRRLAALGFDQRKLALLQEENERLRAAVAQNEKSKNQASELAQRNAIEKAVVQIRGLDFIRPVEYAVLSRAGIRKTLQQKLAETFSDADFENMTAGLETLGVLPAHYPLKQKYIDLLTEQVAAFYDQHQHKLFMFENASLTSSQNRVVLAHELTHALQDEHFGL